MSHNYLLSLNLRINIRGSEADNSQARKNCLITNKYNHYFHSNSNFFKEILLYINANGHDNSL